MISRYFLWTSALIASILLLSSCLNSSNNNSNIEYPRDPQIYTISLSSKTDSTNQLPGIAFTIDQVKEEIYNKNPLPYKFNVDSVMLRVGGSNSYFSFPKVELTVDGNSYVWNQRDSVAIFKLTKIKTTAPDGVTSKEYSFKLNVYKEDPYIISWEKVDKEWISGAISEQKTILYAGGEGGDHKFITYYKSAGGNIEGLSASNPITEGGWTNFTPTGIPNSVLLSSITTTANIIYALDETNGWLYSSADGRTWNPIQTNPAYKIIAIYGELPFTPGGILLAIEREGRYQFAQLKPSTETNLVQDLKVMNNIPSGMPLKGFTSIKTESKTSYSNKFIYLAGGVTATDEGGVLSVPNNKIWVLQEKDNSTISHIVSKRPEEITSLQGSSFFFYDDKTYLLVKHEGKNQMLYTDNHGGNWVKAGDNHALPADYIARTDASVLTDADNYIWIFSGISSTDSQILTDVWRGRFNKFAVN